MLKHLCSQFVARSESRGLEGKKRDDAMMDFMCGAYAALESSKHPDANHVGTVLAMLLSVRGFAECQRIAAGAEG